LVCGSERRKWRIETKITRTKELRYFFREVNEWDKKKKQGIWEMYR
jgi:hypothetical protein